MPKSKKEVMSRAKGKRLSRKEKEEKKEKVEAKIKARVVNVLEEAVTDKAHDAELFLPSSPRPSPPKPKSKPFKIVIGGFD